MTIRKTKTPKKYFRVFQYHNLLSFKLTGEKKIMKISLTQMALFSFYKILLQYSQFFQNEPTNTHINTSTGIMKMSKISKRY